MSKKYFYFQPQYVSKFKCDGSKCDAHCCGGWNIFIDKETFKQYPPEISSRLKFNEERGEYLLTLNDKKRCPFLNEKKLCRIQLEHGENFLSQTCASYPRVTSDFEYFFERSLTVSCPVAADLILFDRAPMNFEFVHVPEKKHSPGGKIFIQKIQATDYHKRNLINIQVAMISILQERKLTIDQRLIVLGFFLDRLEEIFSAEIFDEAALTKLIAAYESKKFLAQQVPLMIQSFDFDAKKFIRLMLDILNKIFIGKNSPQDKKFLDAVTDALQLSPDEKNSVSISTVTENYKNLAAERKNFFTKYSTFLERYLVNELFLNIYPWRFEGSIPQNFFVFAAEYKLFELIIFSAWLKNFDKKNLIEVTGRFTTRFDHVGEYRQIIFEQCKGADIFSIMESLLDGSD